MWPQVAAENIWNQLKASVRIFYQAFITTFQRFIVRSGIFSQKHLIDAFTDLWSTLMNALNLKMDYNDNKAISEIFMIKRKFAMQNMRFRIWQFFDNEIERNIVLDVSWYSTYSITLVSFVFLRDLIFNIAKGTTDPRVEFISQDHRAQFTKLEHVTISNSRLSIYIKISTKHQHLN